MHCLEVIEHRNRMNVLRAWGESECNEEADKIAAANPDMFQRIYGGRGEWRPLPTFKRIASAMVIAALSLLVYTTGAEAQRVMLVESKQTVEYQSPTGCCDAAQRRWVILEGTVGRILAPGLKPHTVAVQWIDALNQGVFPDNVIEHNVPFTRLKYLCTIPSLDRVNFDNECDLNHVKD